MNLNEAESPNDLRISSSAQGHKGEARKSSGLSHLRCLCPDAGLPLVGDTMRGAASKGRQSSRLSHLRCLCRDAGLPSVLRNPDSLLASQRESGFSSNPCKTCKWLVPGTEPQCGFYKTSYDVLGKKLVVHEYAEHVRKNEHMCGEEGYMHEPLEENLTIPVMPFAFAYALLWPLNAPLAVLTGLVEFLEEEVIILRCF